MSETQSQAPAEAGTRLRWSGPVLVTAGATVVALLAGLRNLGRVSFWYDEGQTVGTVDRPLGDALWRIAHWELNQSPFHLLATGWIRLGQSEAFLRFLAVGFWVATVPLLFVLGRRLVDERVGAVAAVAFALHGFALEWAQQFRGYSLAAFLVTLATLALVRLLEDPTPARGLVYGLVAGVAAYAHLFVLLVLGAHALTALLVARDQPRRPYVVAAAVGAVVVAPLGWFALTSDTDPVFWVEGPSRTQAVDVLTDLAGGGGLQVALYLVLGGLGLLALHRSVTARGWTSSWPVVLPLLWVVAPLVTAALVSATVKPLLVARFLLVVVPGAALVAGVGIVDLADRGRRGLAGAAMAALVVVSALGVTRTWERRPQEDWRGAVDLVVEQAEPGDVVVVTPGLAVHPVRYYLERAGAADDLPIEPTAEAADIEGERVWVVSRAVAGAEDGQALVAVSLGERQPTSTQRFTNVVVRRFDRP